MNRICVEVCSGSIADAIAASEAGADRIELNSALQLGGLTPSLALIQETVSLCSSPTIVMVRPRPGGFAYTPEDWRILRLDAESALGLGASGIAFGCLTADRQIDVPRVTEIVRLAGDSETVFHRAFDLTANWEDSLKQLIGAGVTRVMSSGQKDTALVGAETLTEMIRKFGKQIQILPASGINAGNVAELIRKTGATQIHGSFSKPQSDPGYDSGPLRFATNDQIRTADPNLIRTVIAIVNGQSGTA